MFQPGDTWRLGGLAEKAKANMRMNFFNRKVPEDPAGRKFKAKFESLSKRVAPRPRLGLPEDWRTTSLSVPLNLEGFPFSKERGRKNPEGLISFSFNLGD